MFDPVGVVVVVVMFLDEQLAHLMEMVIIDSQSHCYPILVVVPRTVVFG